MLPRLAPLAAALALVVAPPAVRAQRTRDWSPAERTVIGDFSHVSAVAASSDRVYIVAPTAVLLWNPLFHRWDGPYDPPETGLLARVFGALADPLDNTLWMVRPDGWVHYQPDIRLWDHGTMPGGVRDVAFDLDDPLSGPHFLTSTGWVTVARGSSMALPGRPPARPLRLTAVDDAIRANPTLQSNSARILFDPRLRNLRYTSAARAFDGRGWYIGTWGAGLLYLADGAALPERLAFGLTGDRVGALYAAPGGVWAATDRTSQTDAGLTFVASDLSEFRTVTGGPALGLPFSQTRQLVAQGSALWAATDAGVARIEPGDDRVQLFDEGRGLPDSRVLSVASRRGTITAGTAHGIVRLTDSSQVLRLAQGFTDAAIAVAPARGDTIWVGTTAGVYAALPGAETLSRPRAVGASAALQVPVIGLRFMGDTLVGLTEDQLMWRDPKSGAWTLGPTLSNILGRLRAFTLDRNGFWVGGERGIAFARLDTPPLRPLLGGDVPALVRDLAVDAEHLWVATEAGLVRWSLDAIRP